LLTLATGLPPGVEDDGPRSRAVRLVYSIKDLSWPSPSPAACKVAAARELRRTAGDFAGSPGGREHLDAAVSAESEGPAPTPQFSVTSSIYIKV
jgi:hypothetical protein